MGFSDGSVVKIPPANAGHVGLIPGSGISPREGNGNSLQGSCWGNLMGKGAWWLLSRGSQIVRHCIVTKQQMHP